MKPGFRLINATRSLYSAVSYIPPTSMYRRHVHGLVGGPDGDKEVLLRPGPVRPACQGARGGRTPPPLTPRWISSSDVAFQQVWAGHLEGVFLGLNSEGAAASPLAAAPGFPLLVPSSSISRARATGALVDLALAQRKRKRKTTMLRCPSRSKLYRGRGKIQIGI